jgi:deoxyribodipyrimidine photo-lyase
MCYDFKVNLSRYQVLKSTPNQPGPIVYWMRREHRLHDNHSFLRALEVSRIHQQPLIIFVCVDAHPVGHEKQRSEIVLNYEQTVYETLNQEAQTLGVPLHWLYGQKHKVIPSFLATLSGSYLITDFFPIQTYRQLDTMLMTWFDGPIEVVDAHNVVPWFVAYPKQAYGAYALRPKIQQWLPTYIHAYPELDLANIHFPLSTHPYIPTGAEAQKVRAHVEDFILQRLPRYAQRNDPNAHATSLLSPFLHYGLLSAQSLALAVSQSPTDHLSFLEELIVRKELADNFCAYNEHHDSVKGFPEWALKTLQAHQDDKRHYLYDLTTLAQGKTHDLAWNAAQLQMVHTGYMHGYMRMYWAKKILEWTPSASVALAYANELNDTYELDGRDPNGYTGTAWAIGGVHDRPWGERPIFGMIRFMIDTGLKRKFDVGAYIHRYVRYDL